MSLDDRGGRGVALHVVGHLGDLVAVLRLHIRLAGIEIEHERHAKALRRGDLLHVEGAVDDRLDAAVFLFPFLGRVVGDGAGKTVSLGGEARAVDAVLFHQVVHHRLCAALGEVHVVVVGADVVGVSLDDGGGGRVFLHEIADLGDLVAQVLADDRLVDVELALKRDAVLVMPGGGLGRGGRGGLLLRLGGRLLLGGAARCRGRPGGGHGRLFTPHHEGETKAVFPVVADVVVEVLVLEVEDVAGVHPKGKVLAHEELEAAAGVEGAVMRVGAVEPDGGPAAADGDVGYERGPRHEVPEEVKVVGVDPEVLVDAGVLPLHVASHEFGAEVVGPVVAQSQAAHEAVFLEP